MSCSVLMFASDDVTGVGGDLRPSAGWDDEMSSGIVLPFDMQSLSNRCESLPGSMSTGAIANGLRSTSRWSPGRMICRFAVLVTLTDASLKSTSNGGNVGQTDGGDIVFTSADGTTQLDHQIESYNAATGEPRRVG